MAAPYPMYLRDTALWLYLEHRLSYRAIASRLEVGASTVEAWIQAALCSRSRSYANQLDHERRNPALYARRRRAYTLRLLGHTYAEIGKELGTSESTAFNDVRAIAAIHVSGKKLKNR